MIKRLIAMICLATALITSMRMQPVVASAAGADTAAVAMNVEKTDGENASQGASTTELNSNAVRMANIAAIRAKYENSVEITMLAKLIYREARGVPGDTEKAAVVWCVLNRVDAPRYPKTIKKVITQKYQFAWRAKTPVLQKFKDLALDVVIRWEMEKLGYTDVGRVLPSNYLFFAGRNGHNRFRNKYRGGTRWNWSFESPYEASGYDLLGLS